MRTVGSTKTRSVWLAAALLAAVFVIPASGPGPVAQDRDSGEAEQYSEGRRLLEEREWDRAERVFDRIIRSGGSRTEGSLYWKAYAQYKQGRGGEALDTLSELLGSYPDGRWEDDARALRLEIRQPGGERIEPESGDDDDIKLIALQSLMHMQPDRAVPILREILEGDQPPKMKKKALFVLMQLGSPDARDLVIDIASGGQHPELRREALRHVAMLGDAKSHAVLQRIYDTTEDPEIKREILRDTVMWSGTDMLMDAIRQEQDPELRRTAIHVLGMKGRKSELMRLYGSEQSVKTRETIIQALMMAGGHDQIVEIIGSEKNPALRRKAIHMLGATGHRGSGQLLVSIYRDSSEDVETRKSVLQALMMMGDATTLIEIAENETDPELKKKAIHGLAMMRSDEAQAYLMKILED